MKFVVNCFKITSKNYNDVVRMLFSVVVVVTIPLLPFPFPFGAAVVVARLIVEGLF